MADYISFYLSLLLALVLNRQRPDLILSLTTPPFIGLLGKLAAKTRNCRHADWVMDLYPDVMFAHGMARRDGMIFRLLQKVTRLQLSAAHAVIALGPNMARRVSNYTRNETQLSVTWLPLWSHSGLSPCSELESNSLRMARGWPAGDTIFLYSGNMGLGHRFGEFLEAARRLGPDGPRWVFCGSGKRKAEIESFAKATPTARIEVREYAPKSQLREHLCTGDVHLMCLEPTWQGLMVPSKLQASFAVGRPVLYVGGRDCEAAAWIQGSGGGWVVAENDMDGLLAAIGQALDPDERRKRGDAGRQFARQHFDRTASCARLAQLLESGTPIVAAHPALTENKGTAPANLCEVPPAPATLPPGLVN